MLILHRSASAGRLVDALGEVLSSPLEDPVVAEVVAVPTRGVERWISQRLSHRLGAGPAGADSTGVGSAGDGVCANLAFPFPGSLIAAATAAATGYDPATDPWAPERAVWPLVELIDLHREDPALRPLAEHLRSSSPGGSEGEPVRRYPMARHLADLFDRYAVHRPELVMSWIDDESPADDSDGDWQRHLWRLLRDRLDTPSPAERSGAARTVIAAEPGVLDLPERLSVFGLTRLPASHLEVLEAIAVGRDVHLLLLHPSAALWDRLAGTGYPPDGDFEAALHPPSPAVRAPAGLAGRRSQDPTRSLARHPILRSWGRDAREMQLVLAARGLGGGHEYPVDDPGPPTLLRRLQADVRADRAPGHPDRPLLDPDDRSVRVHSCHGRSRQVEVLRDAVMHILDADPRLELRDVIVMCPDIEVFAPLVQAAFGVDPAGSGGAGGSDRGAGEDGDGPPRLRVRLADRSLRQTNPLLSVAARLLDLAGSRVTASEVLDLAARPPVSRRFRFDLDDLSTIEGWVAGSGIRWGIDAAHRRPWSLDRLGANTWSAGMDRLLLGVAMTEQEFRLVGAALPFDDMPSGAVELAGRFSEFVDRLGLAVEGLSGRRTVGGWVAAVVDATESLSLGDPDDSWQHEELRRTLAEAATYVDPLGGGGPDLDLDEIRSLLSARLQGRPTRANFRTGDLTVCTLVPMRSVPHRVVALLGLDDGSFPRVAALDGDDLLLADPRIGDRDARSEDRQLLLDALLAAGDHLIVTYSGRDERTNRPRPPCAPVAELLDTIDATVTCADGGQPRHHVVMHHPLQPFDPANFAPGGAGGARPWSFDPVALAGARALGAQQPVGPWLPGPLPALDEPVTQLDHLIAFVTHPARAFLRRRLSLYLGDRGDDIDDAMPVELDALGRWGVGDRLLEAALAGVPLDRAERAERVRGLLPPGPGGVAVLAEVRSGVEELAAVAAELTSGAGAAGSAEVRVDLGAGRAVIGTVPNLSGRLVVQCSYSRLAAKHRLAAWVRLLALLADRPGGIDGAVTIGRGSGRHRVGVAILRPPGDRDRWAGWARERLEDLIGLYDAGLTHPLPLACSTGESWAAGRRNGAPEDQLVAWARQKWESGRFPGEQADPEHVRLYGPDAPLSALMAPRPGPGDGPADLRPEERTRFGALSRRLWDPVLAVETVTGR